MDLINHLFAPCIVFHRTSRMRIAFAIFPGIMLMCTMWTRTHAPPQHVHICMPRTREQCKYYTFILYIERDRQREIFAALRRIRACERTCELLKRELSDGRYERRASEWEWYINCVPSHLHGHTNIYNYYRYTIYLHAFWECANMYRWIVCRYTAECRCKRNCQTSRSLSFGLLFELRKWVIIQICYLYAYSYNSYKNSYNMFLK